MAERRHQAHCLGDPLSDTPPVGPLDGTLFGDEQTCFGCAPHHAIGFHLRFARQGDGVVSRFTPTTLHEGPPGIMHGGLVSTLADEAAAWALIAATGRFGFTSSFQCRLLRPVRVGSEAEIHAHLTNQPTRVARSHVRISQGGVDCYSGDFTFVVLDARAAEQLLGGPLPESWRRFAR